MKHVNQIQALWRVSLGINEQHLDWVVKMFV
jgi:hypothetical protein